MIDWVKTTTKFGYTKTDLTTKDDRSVVCSCDVCGVEYDQVYRRVWINESRGQNMTCSSKCKKLGMRDRNMVKYGVEHPMCLDSVKQKQKETCKSLYGVEHPMHSDDIKNKTKEYFIEKYGVDNPNKLESIQEKREQTCIDKYGVRCVLESDTIKEKIKQTSLDKYGVECRLSLPSVQEEFRKINKEKYGTEHPSKLPEVQEKVKDTMMFRYGTMSVWGIVSSTGNTTENSISSTLNELGCSFKEARIPNDTKMLDMYDENMKIAIEYNGLYWHNDASPSPRGKNYHLNKTRKCMDAGIRLIHIFEDEWRDRQPQIIGFLRATFGKCKNKVFARKTDVIEIDDKTAQSFYDEFHIQGRTIKGTKSAGLYVGDMLVAAMTFGRHHRGNDGLVLTRLCFRDNWCVVGGASRLFKFLCELTNTTEVISWSDNRWSVGGVYESLGFTKDAELGPDYSYVKIKNPKERISKQSQTKRATKCPDGKTEHEWATERGLARIWDCGKIRWKWTKI